MYLALLSSPLSVCTNLFTVHGSNNDLTAKTQGLVLRAASSSSAYCCPVSRSLYFRFLPLHNHTPEKLCFLACFLITTAHKHGYGEVCGCAEETNALSGAISAA